MTPVNLKLINLLNSFSAKEIKEFKKFVSSPLYTKGRNYLPVLDELLKYNSKGFDTLYARQIYSKLYPDKKFSKQTLKNRFSELYKLGEEFLVYLGLKENEFEKDKILLKKLLDKKLYSPFDSKYTRTSANLKAEKFNASKIQNISFLNDLQMSFFKEKNKIDDLYLRYFEDSQINFCLYLINLFDSGIEFEQQFYDNREYEGNHVSDFLQRLDIEILMKKFSKSPDALLRITSMMFYLYKVFEHPDDEESYFKSHKMFSELSCYIKEDYNIHVFTCMINFCIRKQNVGIKKFQFELFKLYNEKLNMGLYNDLSEKIYLNNHFRDYVYIGIAIGNYQWVENFIVKYSNVLPERYREDEVNLSTSKLFFAYKNYEKSFSKLDNIKTNNYLLYLDASTVKLCCYYEMGKYEEAFMELDKIKHYIRNHKEIPDIHRLFNHNFIRIYQKLLKGITNPEKFEIGFLKSELNNESSVSKKFWLLEKISEIEN